MNTGILKAEGLCKSYGSKRVLEGLDLTIQPGRIYGLIGRNGAGKTTLLGILTGQNTKDSGQVTCDGEPVWENCRALEQICFSRELQPTLFSGPNNQKVRYYLKSAAIFYPNWDQEYADRLLNEFQLEPKKKISQLSKGQMSMVTILIALASRAPITILDEPAAGLDVVMRERFYQLLLEDFAQTGRTFLVSTHIIEEAASVFEQVIILDQGRILFSGPNNQKVRYYLKSAAIFYPNWDQEYADRLLNEFQLEPKKKISQLSKGQMSMVTILIALASRAPITILDEPAAGLDVVMRERFYQLLLEDFAQTGRTFLVSTHIIEEAASVFEQVIILDQGRILENSPTEELVEQFRYISGREDVVDQACAGLEVLSVQQMGRHKTAAVRGSDAQFRQARQADVDVSPMNLQNVFVALCGHGDAQ